MTIHKIAIIACAVATAITVTTATFFDVNAAIAMSGIGVVGIIVLTMDARY